MSKLIGVGVLIAIVLSLVAYSMSGFAYVPVVNNTNLAPQIDPGIPGTGERIRNVTYYANDSQIEIHVFAHASSVSNVAGTFLYINDILISPRSGRPLGAAEEAYRGVDTTVPKGASYRVNFTNYHHYEWREYPYVFKKIR